jgi:hypothetical protein
VFGDTPQSLLAAYEHLCPTVFDGVDAVACLREESDNGVAGRSLYLARLEDTCHSESKVGA